ncbi:MAG TPA: hypothetical protein VLI06_05765 [Solimonas sp.]|nr:hypothetical protein [Solimonas sp.]
MFTSPHLQADDFFNKEFSDPSGIALAVPQDVLHAGAAHQAAGVAPPADMVPPSDFAAVLHSVQGFLNALADPQIIFAASIAVAILTLLGVYLSRLLRTSRPAVAGLT